jgi:hypothetical protein
MITFTAKYARNISQLKLGPTWVLSIVFSCNCHFQRNK